MKSVTRHLIPVALVAAACTGANKPSATEQDESPLSYIWTAEPMAPLCVTDTQGVAGAVLATDQGRLWLWGGANFPTTPAAKGGKKHTYASTYTLTDGQWLLTSPDADPASQPIAYAATASAPEGVYVLGGNDGARILGSVTLKSDLAPAPVPVADLPLPLENAAAAYGDGYLYVVGGQSDDGPSQKAYRLNVGGHEGGAAWEQLPDLPREPRVQCSAAWLDGRLYVAGGYNPADGTVSASLVAYNPATRRWDFIDSLRRPGELQTTTLVGGAMLADTLTHRLLFIGGVDAVIFQEAISRPARLAAARAEANKPLIERLERETAEYLHHAPEWYKFNGEMFSYAPATSHNSGSSPDYRHELSHLSLARAGAAVLFRSDTIYIINGELKPGIRANTTLRLTRKFTTR